VITVSELAKLAGVTTDTVRHYVRIGLLKPRRDPSNRYKLFAEVDVRRLHFIRQAKSLGYTLDEIAQIFHDSGRGRSPCPRVREIIQSRIAGNKVRLEELIGLQQRMEDALERWKTMPDGMPDGESICHLIESTVAPLEKAD